MEKCSSIPYLQVPASVGDVIDRLGILAIKLERVQDPQRAAGVRREYQLLSSTLAALDLNIAAREIAELEQVNRTLWAIEDAIREQERHRRFDDRFIQLARQTYPHNDRRAALKRRINLCYGSEIVEEKLYGESR